MIHKQGNDHVMEIRKPALMVTLTQAHMVTLTQAHMATLTQAHMVTLTQAHMVTLTQAHMAEVYTNICMHRMRTLTKADNDGLIHREFPKDHRTWIKFNCLTVIKLTHTKLFISCFFNLNYEQFCKIVSLTELFNLSTHTVR